MVQEVELKLSLRADCVDQFMRHPLLQVREDGPAEQWLKNRYFDTPGRELTGGGFAMRIRESGEADRRAWRYAIGGDSEKKVGRKGIESWSTHLTNSVIEAWADDQSLKPMVQQLNEQSGLGLQEALLASNREISTSVFKIAATVSGLTVAAGSGAALLVLFVDKG